jgi:hypothetical protein
MGTMDTEARTPKSSRLMPWIAVLAFLPLASRGAITDVLRIDWAPLTLLLAIFLGHRHGARGLAVVFLAGIFMIPTLRISGIWTIGGQLDLWLLGVFACGLASGTRSPDGLLRASPWTWRQLALLFVLPVGIGLWGAELDLDLDLDEWVLSLELSLTYVAFAVLFVAGFARTSAYRVVAVLLAVMLLSQALWQLGLPYSAEDFFDARRARLPGLGETELGYLWIGYGFSHFTTVMVGLAYYATGRVCGDWVRASAPPDKVVTVLFVAALVVLATGVIPFVFVNHFVEHGFESLAELFKSAEAPPVAADPDQLRVTGTRLRRWSRLGSIGPMFPLLGFTAALLGGYRGVLLALLGMALLWTLGAAIQGHLPNMLIPYSGVLVLIGFASLGIVARNRLTGNADRWWSTGWAIYLFLVLWLVFSLGMRATSVYLPFIVAVAVLVGLGAQRLRHWLYAGRVKPNPGWIALLTIIGLVEVLRGHVGAMAEAVKQFAAAATIGPMLEEFDDSWWLVALLALFTLWLFLTALKAFVTAIPACIADIRAAFAALVALLTGRPVRPAPQPDPSAEQERRWWHPVTLLAWLRTGTVWVGLLLALGALGRPIVGYLNESLEEAAEDRNTPETREVSMVEEPDPFMLRAAEEILSARGDVQKQPHRYGAVLETGWHSESGTPDERWRARVRLGRSRDDRYISVFVDIEARRHGVWVEPKGGATAERELRDSLKTRIEERAAALSPD